MPSSPSKRSKPAAAASAPAGATVMLGSNEVSLSAKQLMGTMREMRKRSSALEIAESVSVGQGFNPMGGQTPATMRQQWGIGLMGMPEKKTMFQKCRELYISNDLVGNYVDTMTLFGNDGLRISGIDPTQPLLLEANASETPQQVQMRQWIADSGFDYAKFVNDVMLEYVLCENAVLFWVPNPDEDLPMVTVLNCEDVQVHTAFGKKYLVVTMHGVAPLTQEQKVLIGDRYARILEGKPEIIINGENNEYYRALTAQKNGSGMRMPSLYQIFQDLSIRDLIRMGDWNAAWGLRSIIRLIRRGHDIKQGALAGQDIHFLKAKQAKLVKKGLSTNVGFFDMVTNFDVNISYSHVDPKYFDPVKYATLNERIKEWMGPVWRVLKMTTPIDPDSMKLFQVQIDGLRRDLAATLNELLNSPDFLQGQKPPMPIQVTWSPLTAVNFKLIMERARLGQAAGISSTQTAREDLGYSHARESARITAEHENVISVTPAFEQKQGQGGANAGKAKNGRPGGNDLPPET